MAWLLPVEFTTICLVPSDTHLAYFKINVLTVMYITNENWAYYCSLKIPQNICRLEQDSTETVYFLTLLTSWNGDKTLLIT